MATKTWMVTSASGRQWSVTGPANSSPAQIAAAVSGDGAEVVGGDASTLLVSLLAVVGFITVVAAVKK